MILSIVVGAACFIEWVGFARGFEGPIQNGQVVQRKLVTRLMRQTVDFKIQIEGKNTIVHAYVGKKIAETIPDAVRFHYSGDSSKRVVLYDYEENMIGIVLLFWGLAAALWAITRIPYFRRSLGWA